MSATCLPPRPNEMPVSGAELLAERARVLEQLAQRFRAQADRAPSSRSVALRDVSRELRAEALRFAMAAAASGRPAAPATVSS